jgi:riboflavin kinase/FMN adenylyltransferase
MFGKNRQGKPESFKEYFDVEVIEEVKLNNISVHSTIIKENIKSGYIKEATKLLNHTYKIKGSQIKGQGIGKKEFVPTINLDTKEYLLPKEGVYKTNTNGKKSISFIGKRASTDNNFAIETHFLEEFDESEIYEIEFLEFVRENRKFNSFEELKKQIFIDIENVKNR